MDKEMNVLNKEQRKFLLHELITEEMIEQNKIIYDLKTEIIESEYKIKILGIRINQMELRLKYQQENEKDEQTGQFSDLIKTLLKVPQTVKKNELKK